MRLPLSLHLLQAAISELLLVVAPLDKRAAGAQNQFLLTSSIASIELELNPKDRN